MEQDGLPCKKYFFTEAILCVYSPTLSISTTSITPSYSAAKPSVARPFRRTFSWAGMAAYGGASGERAALYRVSSVPKVTDPVGRGISVDCETLGFVSHQQLAMYYPDGVGGYGFHGIFTVFLGA